MHVRVPIRGTKMQPHKLLRCLNRINDSTSLRSPAKSPTQQRLRRQSNTLQVMIMIMIMIMILLTLPPMLIAPPDRLSPSLVTP